MGSIYLIDAQTWAPGYSSVYLVAGSRGIALVETGLSTPAETILEGIRRHAIRPNDVTHIVLTHLHLDHAGSAGILSKEMPGASVFIHPMGATHLADPSRLLASAGRALGDFGKTYGLDQVVGVESSRIRLTRDGDVLDLGDFRLRAIETPGHAPHHLCFHEESTNSVFVGDLVGNYFPETGSLSLTSSAPNFDLKLTIESIGKIKALKPDVLYFSHFGPARPALPLLERSIEQLLTWERTILEALRHGKTVDDIAKLIAADLIAAGPSFPHWLHAETARVYAMGYLKYLNSLA
ncbi:MAG: MBL fold metallo-hydrolase [Dehalococcoidia bacterium]|nr:MBL fold metallo-hydrolase [Dehalococcoidia bacterium]